MRYINRADLTPPEALFSKRVDEQQSIIQGFISETASKGGTRRVPSSNWLTNDHSFQAEVSQSFSGLCAYCESDVDQSNSSSSLSRFHYHRPGTLAQDEQGNTDLLSYCWLMYQWDNMLWVCDDCARRKGNLFFVEAKRGPPNTPIKKLREFEQELLLDPCFHNPVEHLEFGLDGSVKWISPAGHATTEVLDLGRKELVWRRQNAFRDFINSLQELESIEARFLGAHSGAARLAVLSFARQYGMTAKRWDVFLSEFDEFDATERENFLDAAMAENAKDFAQISTSQTPPLITTTTGAQRPNRIPRVSKLPTATAPVTHVEIKNFKALEDITFDLPNSVEDPEQSPCMILLGENATGKSSVLEAMALAVIGADEAAELDKVLKDEDLCPRELIHRVDPSRWDEPSDTLEITLQFLDIAKPVQLMAKADDARFSGSEECAKIVLGYGPRRYFTNRKSRRLRAPAHRVRSLFDPLDMIANPIHWLSGLENDEFFAAARAMREILMLDKDDDFERNVGDDDRGQILIRQNGQLTALKDLSVGYKSVIAMACDIIRELLYHFDNLEFAHAIVFIDEIETHLHPRWKMQIMQLMRQAFPKVQFIVTTHDPLCLRGMYDGEVFVLERSALAARVEAVADLPSIRGMRAEQILTSEFFGLGSTDPKTDAALARYNALAAKHEGLTDVEQTEMEKLQTDLDGTMVIGTTIAEQVYADVLKEQNAKHQIAPTKANSPRRDQLKVRFSSLFDENANS